MWRALTLRISHGAGKLLEYALYLFAPVGILCGIVAMVQMRSAKAQTKGRNHAIAGLVLSLAMTALPALEYPAMNGMALIGPAYQTQCARNLRHLGNAVLDYTDRAHGHFPNPARWSEALILPPNDERVFVCTVGAGQESAVLRDE